VLTDVIKFENSEAFAQTMDRDDPLSAYRSKFSFPKKANGEPYIYLAGNSLGLMPKITKDYVNAELDDWAEHGVEGHLSARLPWLPYHENLTGMSARLVGAKPSEVVVMNSLTVNLHLMMVSFYKPTKTKFKIFIESNAFPSDQYAVKSQAKFHSLDPNIAIGEFRPRTGELTLRTEDILETIAREGQSLCLIVLGQVNYLTGQAFDIPAIVEAAHKVNCVVGLNLAHGAGNLVLKLHDWNVDFAVWCSYKYLNAGPGGIAGTFVHECHGKSFDLPRFAGWWGHNKKTRFAMPVEFDPLAGGEGWQLSNPPILQLAALRASMEIFDQATMPALRKKGDLLTGYLEFLLEPMKGVSIITPPDITARGNQLSLKIKDNPKQLLEKLKQDGVIGDFREPDIIRVAPAPLYNNFQDVYRFCQVISKYVR